VLDHEIRGDARVVAARRALVERAQALFPRIDRVASAVRAATAANDAAAAGGVAATPAPLT
jgi:hypothetical protein